MTKDELIDNIKSFYTTIQEAYSEVKLIKTSQITNKATKNKLNEIASKWFSSFSNCLISYGLSEETKKIYDDSFKTVLALSVKNNRCSSYEKQLKFIEKNFVNDVLLFIQTNEIERFSSKGSFSLEATKLLEKLPDKDENEYLQEAIGCWEHDYLKAAVVLAWCAAIDRIHRVIEKNGFTKFNKTSSYMKAQTVGRYKRFNKEFDVSSISDLQLVFDSDILWVLEGMQMIDTNEKTRLSSCFDMRCHSGHPGLAPITKYNVLSCFSDIIEIVLSNPKFTITTHTIL